MFNIIKHDLRCGQQQRGAGLHTQRVLGVEAASALPPLRHHLRHPGQWSLGIYPPEFLQF